MIKKYGLVIFQVIFALILGVLTVFNYKNFTLELIIVNSVAVVLLLIIAILTFRKLNKDDIPVKEEVDSVVEEENITELHPSEEEENDQTIKD